MGIAKDVGAGPVAVDTVGFIYFIEEHRDYLSALADLFSRADRGDVQIVTSSLTLLEVLVVPLGAGDSSLASRYELLLTRSRGVSLVEIGRIQLRAAAQLRAVYRLKIPDAIQIAAALSRRCTAFVTNDRDLPTLSSLRVLQLRDYAF